MGDQPTSPAANPPGVVWGTAPAGSFSPGNGVVRFSHRWIIIRGNSTFYDFWCDTTAPAHPIWIYFEQLMTQTVTHDFHIVGTGANRIQLMSLAKPTFYASPPPDDPTLNPTAPPPTNWAEQWLIRISGTATIEYADVQLSWADTFSVTPGPTCTDRGYNDNWYFFIPIIASWTVDSNENGRIDRIRVQVQVATQLSDNLGQLVSSVQGYNVSGFGTAAGANDDVFDILLTEGTHEDTDAHPRWQLLQNPPTPGLFGIVGGALVEYGPKVYTAEDGARPVITYTLAAAWSNKEYVHFSEPVYGNNAGTALIDTASLNYSDLGNLIVPVSGVQPLEMTGNAAHAAMVTFTNPLTADNILLGTAQTINALAGQIWDQRYQDWFDPINLIYPGNPGAYANTNLDGNLPLSVFAGPPYSGKAMFTTAHRVSDVGLNIIEPVFADDQVTQRDPVRGGIGHITMFDGSAWLQDLDILLQAKILAATAAAWNLRLWWDVNVTDPILLSNLWVPGAPGATTLFPPAGGDSYHNGNIEARSQLQTAIIGDLRNFLIPSSDPEIKDGADLQLLFVLDDGAGNLLPCARVADPLDPRTAAPWSWKVRDLRAQRGEVTIMKNVINPDRNEKTDLHYTVATAGRATISVFDLAGNLVTVLFNGSRTPGKYTTTWDGRNRGGRIVARGVYFIRVVGPGFDEMRKVLVVK